jgi:uncharacterized protein
MEEILASIRRIIESNDPASDAAGLHAAPDAYAEDLVDEDGTGFDPDLVANDPGMPLQFERRPMPETPVAERPAPDVTAATAPAERSLSLADVAARVRAASARHQELSSLRPAPRVEEAVARVPEPAALAPAPIAALRPAPEQELRQPEAKEPEASEPEVREPAAPVVSLPMPELRAAHDQAAEMRRPDPAGYSSGSSEESKPQPASSPEPVRSEAQETPRLPVQMDALAGLLSDAAGAQVAKSFGELADVFDGLERRSVEDMAQDMLRPMLQEWLDDNLPTLVERLVREEIERVARGPRR